MLLIFSVQPNDWITSVAAPTCPIQLSQAPTPAGDHLYRMNYQDFVHTHRKSGADITVAALPTDEKQAAAFGLMKINDSGKIIVSPGLWRARGAVYHADSV